MRAYSLVARAEEAEMKRQGMDSPIDPKKGTWFGLMQQAIKEGR